MDATLYKLTQLDFCALDLKLYLDTHPKDTDALAEYNKIAAEAARLRADYEGKNRPLTAGPVTGDSFVWIDEPWNWEESYN